MLNLTSLNQRINYLLTEINKKIENPLTSDLDANGFDILNVNNIDLNTINGGVYPPVVPADDLNATLTAGNSAGANDIDMNNNDIINIKEIELNGTSTLTDATGDLVIQPPLNQTLQLGNNIYIDTNTNRVGINVPVPTEDLEIDGNIQMDTGSTSKIVFYDAPNAHEHGEIDATGEGVNGGIVKIQTKIDGGGVTEKLRINNTGAIGLGGANYGTTGQVLTSQGSTALPTWSSPTTTGYSFVERLRFTSVGSFTFTKASYPYLRAIKVVCVGGGGGGGQTDYFPTAGDAAAGAGGGGGTYAERFITNIAGLATSVPIVVGDGGAGGTGGVSPSPLDGVNALDGDPSEFGTPTDAYYVKGGGGAGGNKGAETGAFYGASGVDGLSGVGDFTIIGYPSGNSWSVGSLDATANYIIAFPSNGGNSVLGTGGRNGIIKLSGGNKIVTNGGDGLAFGGGGAGGAGAVRVGGFLGANGGNGARGTVWVELYA